MPLFGAPSVAGEWRGVYRYDDPYAAALTTQFVLTLTLDGDLLGGAVRDLGGPLGGATITRGVQNGFAVIFFKSYDTPPPEVKTTAVQYEGILSDDGRSLRGTWRLTAGEGAKAVTVTGTWEARRAAPDPTLPGR
jgi:hypothetical protein